jgi:DNA polymerase III epsilon subunit-like protein
MSDLLHLNGNVLCCIDVETTGLNPAVHEIIQVCFLPLDANLEPKRDVCPFDIIIKPDNIDDIDYDAMKVSKSNLTELLNQGLDKYDAADLFEKWCDKLQLATGKRISPLAQNWLFDAQFIRAWLGDKTYEYYIDGRYRDLMCTTLYLNDVADRENERVPFPKVNLPYIAAQMRIPHDRAHNALDDCIVTAQCYRDLVKKQLPVSAQHL